MNQPNNTHRIDCLHDDDGYIQIVVPAAMSAEFKLMASRAIGTWQDATPQMRDFIDRLLQREMFLSHGLRIIKDEAIANHELKMIKGVVESITEIKEVYKGVPTKPLFTDLTKATIRLLTRIDYAKLSPSYKYDLTSQEEDLVEGTKELIYIKHGQVNAELNLSIQCLCLRLGVPDHG